MEMEYGKNMIVLLYKYKYCHNIKEAKYFLYFYVFNAFSFICFLSWFLGFQVWKIVVYVIVFDH